MPDPTPMADTGFWAMLGTAMVGSLGALGRAFKTGRDVTDVRARLHKLANAEQVTLTRVVSLETHNQDIDRRLERIEAKLDRLIERAG